MSTSSGTALKMPSNYAVINEEEMMYLEGGRTNVIKNMPINSADTYLGNMQVSCRTAAVAAAASVLGAISMPIVMAVLGVGATVTASTYWSWADVYANARAKVLSMKPQKVLKVNITEVTSGFNLSVSVNKAA